MRTAVLRPLVFIGLLLGVCSAAHSQPVPGGGVNFAYFNPGSPTPTVGGVDVSVFLKPTLGWKCNSAEIVVIENASGKTLDSKEILNPGNPTNVSFTKLDSKLEVQVAVTATFQCGILLEVKFFDAVVTTK